MIEDEAAIAFALEDLSVPTLMLSLVHRTGDPMSPRRLVDDWTWTWEPNLEDFEFFGGNR